MKSRFAEVLVPVLLVVVLASLAQPVLSDHTMVMAQQGILLALFVAYALLVWREVGGDERDDLHRHLAGRIAYLVGSGVLVAGIIVQSLSGAVDPWLIATLAAMVLAKAVGIAFARYRR
jgi:hypothetical protein